MNLESNDIENWNLNQILQENITYFNENPLFTSEIPKPDYQFPLKTNFEI